MILPTLEQEGIVGRLVKPHSKISRRVQNADIIRVQREAKIMLQLCTLPIGIHEGGIAIAHPQIDKQDPLRFFVTKNDEVVINPVIIRQTKFKVPTQEGCLSFPMFKPGWTSRSHKVEIEYQEITKEGVLSDVKVAKLKGLQAHMVQHEIEHFDGKYVYDLAILEKPSDNSGDEQTTPSSSEENTDSSQSDVSQNENDGEASVGNKA